MRALLVTRAGVGGAARHVLDVVRGLAGRHSIVVLASPLENPGFLDALRTAGARVEPLPLRRAPHPPSDLRARGTIRRTLTRGRFDVVHAHTAKAGAVARLAGGDVPVVYSPHGFFHLYPTTSRPLRRIFLSLERMLSERTSVLAACAEWEAADAREAGLAPSGRTVVIPNGIGAPELLAEHERYSIRRSLDVPEGGRLVLMAGRLGPPKEPLTYLKAATMSDPRTVFALAGDGEMLGAARRIAPPNARVLGARMDVPRLLSAADAAVLASRFEAAPYFLLEAMAGGCPIAATDLPATRETLGDAGILVPPGDAAALARGIEVALAGGPALGARGRDRAAERYSIDRMLAATEAAWELARL